MNGSEANIPMGEAVKCGDHSASVVGLAPTPIDEPIVQASNVALFPAKRLMVESAGDQRLYQVFDLMLRVFAKDVGEFERARFKAEAHITACVHRMHTLSDIIGQTIYLGLGMNLDPALAFKDERWISVSNVAERLPAGPVAEHVRELVNGEAFRHLAAMNNHSKHRSFGPVGIAPDFTGEDEEPSGLSFNAFRYAGKDHQARWMRPILTTEYQRQETLLHALGNALNAKLAVRP